MQDFNIFAKFYGFLCCVGRGARPTGVPTKSGKVNTIVIAHHFRLQAVI